MCLGFMVLEQVHTNNKGCSKGLESKVSVSRVGGIGSGLKVHNLLGIEGLQVRFALIVQGKQRRATG